MKRIPSLQPPQPNEGGSYRTSRAVLCSIGLLTLGILNDSVAISLCFALGRFSFIWKGGSNAAWERISLRHGSRHVIVIRSLYACQFVLECFRVITIKLHSASNLPRICQARHASVAIERRTVSLPCFWFQAQVWPIKSSFLVFFPVYVFCDNTSAAFCQTLGYCNDSR